MNTDKLIKNIEIIKNEQVKKYFDYINKAINEKQDKDKKDGATDNKKS